jgi:hypothetical protein
MSILMTTKLMEVPVEWDGTKSISRLRGSGVLGSVRRITDTNENEREGRAVVSCMRII